MALIRCSECGKEISDLSNICIHCGVPLKNKKIEKAILIIQLLFIINKQKRTNQFYNLFFFVVLFNKFIIT